MTKLRSPRLGQEKDFSLHIREFDQFFIDLANRQSDNISALETTANLSEVIAKINEMLSSFKTSGLIDG